MARRARYDGKRARKMPSARFTDRHGQYAYIGRILYNTAALAYAHLPIHMPIIFHRTVPAQHASLTYSRPPLGSPASLPSASSRRSARLLYRRMPMVTASPRDSPLKHIPNLPLGDIRLEGEQHSELLPKADDADAEVGPALIVVAVLGDRSSAWK